MGKCLAGGWHYSPTGGVRQDHNWLRTGAKNVQCKCRRRRRELLERGLATTTKSRCDRSPCSGRFLYSLPVESTSSRAQDSRNGSSTSNPRSPTWNSIFLRLFRTPKGLASPRAGKSEAKIMVILGTKPDQRDIHFAGTALWAVQHDGVLLHNWVEQALGSSISP
jgi:hypothetical protein